MEYENHQAQEAAKRQEEENLKAARRGNYIAWFVAMGALLSGFAALALFFESLG